MPYINVIQPENAEGDLKTIYDGLKKSRGKIADIHKIYSINPDILVKHMDLYLTSMFGRSPLKRYQREMMAVIVSKTNNCEYCIVHHLDALKHFWKDEIKTSQFLDNYLMADLSDYDKSLCHLSEELTLNPNSQIIENIIVELKEKSIDDRSIHDAVTIISYFNFVNRIVLGLGVDLAHDPGGYNYE